MDIGVDKLSLRKFIDLWDSQELCPKHIMHDIKWFTFQSIILHIVQSSHNNYHIYVIIPFIYQASMCQLDETIWITIDINSYS